MSNQIVAPATTMCPEIDFVAFEEDLAPERLARLRKRVSGMFRLLAAYLKVTGLLGLGWLTLWIVDHIGASYAMSGEIPYMPSIPWRPSTKVLMMMSGNLLIVQHAAQTMSFWWPFIPLAVCRSVMGDTLSYMITRRSLEFVREHRHSRSEVRPRGKHSKSRLRKPIMAIRRSFAYVGDKLRLNLAVWWIRRKIERLCNGDGWCVTLGLFLMKASPVPMPVPAAMLAATTNAKRWQVAVAILCGAFVKIAWVYWTVTTLKSISL